jgi:hypothetical protein
MLKANFGIGYRVSGIGLRFSLKPRTDHRTPRAGQTTLELTAALIVMMLLLAGSVKIFMWLNERLIKRQVDYEATRVTAANATPESVSIADGDGVAEQDLKIVGSAGGTEVLPDESAYPALNVFGKLN